MNPEPAASSERPTPRAVADAPARPPEAAHADQAAQAGRAAEAALVDRERWLFRQGTRAGQVHPLRHLLRRYRAGERA